MIFSRKWHYFDYKFESKEEKNLSQINYLVTYIIKSYKEYRLKIRFFIDQSCSLDTFSISLGFVWKKLPRSRCFYTKSCVFTKHVAK